MHEGWLIASKVLAVFAVMLAGVGARRIGWLTRDADASLMRLAVNVMLPSLFFSRVVTDTTLGRFADVAVPPLVGFGLTLVSFAIAGLVAATMQRALAGPPQRRAFTFCTGIGNYGYIPLPVAIAFFPSSMATMIVHNLGVELALWSVGLLIISGSIGANAWRRVLNPPVIAIAVALLISLTGQSTRVPQLAIDATTMMGQAAIPLGLVLSGAVIYDLWREANWLANWRVVAASAGVRLVALPIVFLLVARYAGVSLALQKVLVVQAAMPAATFPLVVTKLYAQDTSTAFRVIVGTTLLGVITIPLWIAIGCWWCGLTLG